MLDVSSLLELPSIRKGIPRVVAGADKLDNIVRWLHIGDVPNISHFLQGGEAILTSGSGFGKTEAAQETFVRSVADSDISALILELQTIYENPPPAVVRECERLGIPLIALERPVAFVDISQEVHGALIDKRVSYLSRKEQLSNLFAAKILEGCSLQELLDVLSDQLGNPVVLVDQFGSIAATADRGIPESELTIALERNEDGRVLRVALPGRRANGWTIETLSLLSRFAEQDLLALDQGATAVSILISQDLALTGLDRGDHDFILGLADDSMSPADVALKAARLGFDASYFMPFALIAKRRTVLSDPWDAFVRLLRGKALPMLLSSRNPGVAFGILAIDESQLRKDVVTHVAQFVGSVSERTGLDTEPTIISGRRYPTWMTLASGIKEVSRAVPYVRRMEIQGVYDVSKPDVRRLMLHLSGDNDLKFFVEDSVGPLLDYDRSRQAQLYRTLLEYCRCGGNKSETARRLFIERPTLYDRLSRIEEILGEPVADPLHFFGLQMAVFAHEASVAGEE